MNGYEKRGRRRKSNTKLNYLLNVRDFATYLLFDDNNYDDAVRIRACVTVAK